MSDSVDFYLQNVKSPQLPRLLNSFNLKLNPKKIFTQGMLLYLQQDPVLFLTEHCKILLDLDCLQLELISELFKCLQSAEYCNFYRLILSNLKSIDHFESPKETFDLIANAVISCHTDIVPDIINLLPILDYLEDVVAPFLSNLLKDNVAYLIPVLDALTTICTLPDLIVSAHQIAFEMINLVPPHQVPVIVTFVFNFIDQNSALIVIGNLRDALRLETIPQIDSNCETLLSDSLKQAFKTKPFLANQWMRYLVSQPHLTALDFLVLIILYPSHCKKVAGIIITKIEKDALNSSFVSNIVQNHFLGLRPFLSTVIVLGEALLSHKSSKSLVVGIELLKKVYLMSDIHERQDIMAALTSLVAAGTENSQMSSLVVLLDLCKTDYLIVEPFGIFIKSLIDYLEILKPHHVRLLYQILAMLACRPWINSTDSHHEPMAFTEMHMLIRKQLSHFDNMYRTMGLIGALELIKELCNADREIKQFAQLAQDLFHLALTLSRESDILGVFYTFTAEAIESKQLPLHFIEWMYAKLQPDFLSQFVQRETELTSADDCDQRPKWQILFDLTECSSVMPLLNLTFGNFPEFSNTTKIVNLESMCSHARVLRACATELNASGFETLLDMGVQFFCHSCNVEYDNPTAYALCTTSYHTINWLRQSLNLLLDEDKMIARVKNLILVNQIFKSLNQSIFWDSSDLYLRNAAPSKQPDSQLDFVKKRKPKPVEVSFCMLEPSVFKIFNAACCDIQKLEYSEWCFLLTELNSTIKRYEKSKRTNELTSSCRECILLDNICSAMPGLCSILEYTGKAVEEALQFESLGNFSMSIAERPLLDIFLNIMEILHVIFSMQMINTETEPVIWECLGVIAKKSSTSAPLSNIEIVQSCLTYLRYFENALWSFESAFKYAQAFISIYSKFPRISQAIVYEILHQIEQREWSGKIQPLHLEYILSNLMLHADDSISIMENYVNEAFPALTDANADILTKYPLLNHETFLQFYRATLNEISRLAEKYDPIDFAESLDSVTRLFAAFGGAVQLIKSFDHPHVVLVLLKSSRYFIQALIKNMLPKISKNFIPFKEPIVEMLRNVQTGTRMLHNVCNEYKASRDQAIQASIPLLCKSLESFVYQVKQMLAENNVLHAFWVGNLKHRNIKGKEIGSQLPVDYEREPEDDQKFSKTLAAILEQHSDSDDNQAIESLPKDYAGTHKTIVIDSHLSEAYVQDSDGSSQEDKPRKRRLKSTITEPQMADIDQLGEDLEYEMGISEPEDQFIELPSQRLGLVCDKEDKENRFKQPVFKKSLTSYKLSDCEWVQDDLDGFIQFD